VELVAEAILALVLSTYAGASIFKWRRRRALERSSAKHVAQLRDGELATVTGVVRRVAPLIKAPITGRPGVLMTFRIEDKDIASLLSWGVRAEGGSAVAFEVVEDGVAALVDTDGVVPPFAGRHHQEAVEARKLTSRQLHALKAMSIRVPPDRSREYRFTEAILAVGDEVRVTGRVTVEVDPRGERESLRGPPVRRVFRGTQDEPLILTRPPPPA
jgi:hypothetical protein